MASSWSAIALVCSGAGRDEARHVAFGVAHTAHVVTTDPQFLTRLRMAVERRHDALADTAGLNQEVFDSLVIIAAGSWEPAAIERGWRAVQQLQQSMDEGPRRRLASIGFPDAEAAALSALHTRNFMSTPQAVGNDREELVLFLGMQDRAEWTLGSADSVCAQSADDHV